MPRFAAADGQPSREVVDARFGVINNASGAVMALVLPPGGATAEAAQAVDRRSGLGRDGEKTGETSTRRGFGGRSLETWPHFLRTVAQSS